MGEDLEILRSLQHPRYHQVRLLSAGTFGSVVLATDSVTQAWVALKFLSRRTVAGNSYAEAEILNQMRLHHPHVLPLEEVFLTSHSVVMVLEYCPGGPLIECIPANHGLPEPDARWLFQQVLFALDYCHGVGIASRDIKLENILLVQQPPLSPRSAIVKLADWGLSTVCRPGQLQEGSVGTPAYMAPEVIVSRPGRQYDAKKADVWSCGVLLYILLTGRFPFLHKEDENLATMDERVAVLFQRILQLDYKLPEHFSENCRHLLVRMLSPDPRQRPTAREVLRHPFCQEGGLNVEALLQINDGMIARTLASPPQPEVVQQVLGILEEAKSTEGSDTALNAEPRTPPAQAAQAQRNFQTTISSDEVRAPMPIHA